MEISLKKKLANQNVKYMNITKQDQIRLILRIQEL